ncbi:MAG: hypothetical protein KatS3mg020_0557 [Fimbriimonadales bacterium]|nr:MAG: hypothetical protein KatS3mg020_0557 [Fimbriimonadales bacterium]
MAEIVRVEWITYQRRSDTQDWLSMSELGKAFPLQQRQIKTIDTVIVPRVLIGVVSLRSRRPERVQVEVEITYLLMRERTMSGVARTFQRYHAFHAHFVNGSGLIEIPLALDADENYFSRAYPDLVMKSVVLKARLVVPMRTGWRSARVDYLHTPWGD